MEKAAFYKLLDKYISGEASQEEEQQLLNFYGSFNKSSNADLSDLGEKMESRMLQALDLDEQVQSSRWKPFGKFAIAASVIMAVALSLYFYTGSEEIEPETFAEIDVKNDIAPGDNKAILTLADGSRISLDDAAEGFVASQGNTSITKTEDGQIVYNKNGGGMRSMNGSTAANTIQTPKGGRYQIRLPDGSRVWLNSASTLTYPTTFAVTERKVKLIGEAYFEIARNKKVPFRVESNNQTVEVLGTHFNVNSYEDEAYIKTTLLEGSVRIILNSSNPKGKLLKPGEQSLTSASQADIKVQDTDIEKAIAWKNGYFKFKNTPIKDIMREIERWYDVELVYDGKLAPDEFTGYISNEVKISGVLKMLEESGGIKFSVKGRKLKVKSIQ
ncbi:FecR family protein [Daejeonella lutea]|uniref:FecR family protein n=1 Tax=Daejeonella lutea TaxID=572036 RepID=A0A1T5ABK5_9SPHI|nr:FecR domain-containing protein [Daejeonella lutea]SKB32338.1 FecR family protein [Daejeonella lutea]